MNALAIHPKRLRNRANTIRWVAMAVVSVAVIVSPFLVHTAG